MNKAGLKAYFKQYYKTHKIAWLAGFKQYYQAHKQRIQAARLQYYGAHRSEMIAAARAQNAKAVLRRARRYYVRHGPQCRSNTRWRYELAEPKCYAKEQHVLELTKKLMLGSTVLPKLVKAFDKKYKGVSREMTTSAYQFEDCHQILIVDEQGRCRPTCNELMRTQLTVYQSVGNAVASASQ